MHQALNRTGLLAAVCAFVSGCSSLAPGWGSAEPAGQAVPVITPAVVTTSLTPEQARCHDEAWGRRLEIPGDQELAYGQAYRECMARPAAGDRPARLVVSTPLEPARPAPGRLTPKAARN